jgi:hypothetical protein
VYYDPHYADPYSTMTDPLILHTWPFRMPV